MLKESNKRQFQDNKYVTTQFTGEYTGINYTATASAGNLDFNSRSGVLVAQYLQNIQPRIALGAEYAYQYAPQIPGELQSYADLGFPRNNHVDRSELSLYLWPQFSH